MYLYFDKNGLLKEVINDEALRVGSDGANTVFAYFEGDRIINGVYFNILRNGDTSPIRHAYTSLVSKQIPYDANRTLNYFKYFVNYNFYTYTFDSTDLAIDGLLKLTIQAYDNSDIVFALGLVPLIIEASAVATTTQITTSEYENLLKSIANCPTWSALESYIGLSRSDLQGLTLANVKAYIDSYHIASVDNTMLTGVLNTKITLNNGDNTAGSVDLSNSFYLKGLTYSKEEADAKFASTANVYNKNEIDNLLNNKANTTYVDQKDLTLQTNIDTEATTRANADTHLQNQIDTIEAGKNVADIVGTYAELEAYPITNIAVGDIIQVMADETQGGSTSNYRLTSKSPKTWSLVGTEAPTYTKTESDSKFATIIGLNNTNKIVGNNTSEIADIKTNYATNSALATTNQNVTNNANEITSIKANYATTASLATVATSGNYNDLTNKPTIPTKTSELTNDTGYITATNYAGETVGGVILASSLSGSETNLVEIKINTTTHKLYAPSIPTLDIEIVSSLPTTGSTGVIYLVPATSTTTTNLYKEYVWVNSAWEEIGNLDIQLSSYATLTYVNSTFFKLVDFTGTNIVSVIGDNAINRATSDSSGNNIINTYATKVSVGTFTILGTVETNGTITFTTSVADIITAITNKQNIIFKPSTTYNVINLAYSISGTTYTLTGSVAINETSNITNYECMITIVDSVATGTYIAKQPSSGATFNDITSDYTAQQFLSETHPTTLATGANNFTFTMLTTTSEFIGNDFTYTYGSYVLTFNISGTKASPSVSVTSSSTSVVISTSTISISDNIVSVVVNLTTASGTYASTTALSEYTCYVTTGTYVSNGNFTQSGQNTQITCGIMPVNKLPVLTEKEYEKHLLYLLKDGYNLRFIGKDVESDWAKGSSITGAGYTGTAYGLGGFVAVAYSSYSYYSTDGITWTSTSGCDGAYSVAYGNGRFIAVGRLSNSYYKTTLSGSWSNLSGLNGTFYGVAYGNGRFIAVGSSGAVYQLLDDSTTWTACTSTTTSQLNSVCYGNGRFVMIAVNGDTQYLLDGSTTCVAMTDSGSVQLNAVAYNGTKFVAVGASGSSIQSTSGTSWSNMTNNGLLASQSYFAITSYGTRFICVGANGNTYDLDSGSNVWSLSKNMGASTVTSCASICYSNETFVATCGANTSINNLKYATLASLAWQTVNAS